MNSQSGSTIRTLAAFTVACAISGCSHEIDGAAIAQSAECSVRVIIGFAGEPTVGLLENLERTNALALDPIGTITNDLRVYTLRTAGSDEDCVAAIERLRRAERVRSVDIDADRELHEQ
jgi:hypothetical protein